MAEYRRKATADRRKVNRRASVVDVAPVIVPPPVIIEPPPVVVLPPVSGSNEPAGMTKLGEHDCSVLTPSGWGLQQTYAGGVVVAVDQTAPKSPPGVLQQNFTSKLTGGSSPGIVGKGLNPQPKTLYVAFWMKLSSNFQGHTVTNKVMHGWIGGRNRAILAIAGVGAGKLTTRVGFQGLALPYRGATEINLESTFEVVRARWHKYEMLLVANTPGVADGSFSYWLDGIKVAEYTGIGYVASGQNGRWEEFMWSPTYGGVGGTIVTPFYSQCDHLYLSGA